MTPGLLALVGEVAARPEETGGEGPRVRLSASPSPLPNGPRRAQRGPLVAVADLRLDNRSALRAELAVPDGDDLDLLLAAYERWADGLAAHLEGPFAYVVWDPREGRVSFARDRLGLRPLYVASGPRGVVIGSSLPRVRQAAPGGVCVEALADHLAGRFDHPHATFVRGIERVPAAHRGAVSVPDGTVWMERYWALAPDSSHGAILDGEAEETFREAFDQAVLARLGETPGALLSGGLDSSSIVATARSLRPDLPLPTFSIVYDTPAADERRYLDAVAERSGVDPLRVQGEGLSLLAGLDDDLRAVGEPFFTPNLFLTRSLYAEAAARGLGAVLDGFAGDNVVGHGDHWLTELALSLRWPSLWREVRGAARRSSRPRRAVVSLLRQYALDPLATPFRRRVPPPRFLRREWASADRPRDPSYLRDRDLHLADLSGPTLPRAFEVAYTRAAALGIEPRFPFADRRLVEVCLALPPRQRVRDGLTRSILRRAMGDRLPDVLRDRSGKARLGGTFEDALFDRDPDLLRQLVEEDVPAASEYLDVAAVQAAYYEAVQNPETRGAVALPLWRAVTVARWLSTHADPPSSP